MRGGMPSVIRRTVGRILVVLVLGLVPLPLAAQAPYPDGRPKVRAITAFVRIDRDRAAAQLLDAVSMLRAARSRFQKNGWEVETIRVTTQPFPEYVRGLNRAQALGLLADLDAIAAKERFLLGLGPAMSRDDDDPATMDLLGELLARARMANATALIAGDDGVHWKAVRAAARMCASSRWATPG